MAENQLDKRKNIQRIVEQLAGGKTRVLGFDPNPDDTAYQILAVIEGEGRIVAREDGKWQMGGGRVGLGFNEQTGDVVVISLKEDYPDAPRLGIRQAHQLGIEVEIPDSLRQREKLVKI